MTDANLQVVAAYRYDGFGVLKAKSGTLVQPYQFSTKRYLAAIGVVKYEYRDYLPVLGKWAERDPLGEMSELNLYLAMGNNSMYFIDPDGLRRQPGKTPPGRWPKLPKNLGGKKPKWNCDGYWEGKDGGKYTWDQDSHGTGHDRGKGPQDGHWDDEKSGDRHDRNGNPLPGNKQASYSNSLTNLLTLGGYYIIMQQNLKGNLTNDINNIR